MPQQGYPAAALRLVLFSTPARAQVFVFDLCSLCVTSEIPMIVL